MDNNTAFPDTSSYYKKTTKRPRGILVIVILLILLLTGIFLGIRYFGGDSGSKIQGMLPVTPSPTASPTPEPTEEPTPTEAEEDETPTPDSKKSGTPTPSPTGGTAANKNALTVSVLNGSGVSGVAAEMKTKLTDLGYTVVSTGNADNFDYESVTIKVKPTKKTSLAKLKSDLSSDYTVAEATSDLATSETADAVVIVGK
jgi:hypothetical protein